MTACTCTNAHAPIWFARVHRPVRFNGTNAYRAVARRASLVLMGGMAHAHSAEAIRATLEMNLEWLRRTTQPGAEIAVLEYLPAHFPGTAFGEFYQRLTQCMMHALPRACVHSSPLTSH